LKTTPVRIMRKAWWRTVFDGLLLAVLYRWRESILPPLLAHALGNAIAFLS
jgi:membrane protease YdiL (CAAX protease family)